METGKYRVEVFEMGKAEWTPIFACESSVEAHELMEWLVSGREVAAARVRRHDGFLWEIVEQDARKDCRSLLHRSRHGKTVGGLYCF